MQRAGREIQAFYNPVQTSGLFELPEEMLMHIISFLPPNDILALSRTSTDLRRLAHDHLRRDPEHNQVSIQQSIRFFNIKKDKFNDYIDSIQNNTSVHPIKNICITLGGGLLSLSSGIYISKPLGVEIILCTLGTILLLCAGIQTFFYGRSYLKIQHAYQRINDINDAERGLVKALSK